jgi:hypothetical protein
MALAKEKAIKDKVNKLKRIIRAKKDFHKSAINEVT